MIRDLERVVAGLSALGRTVAVGALRPGLDRKAIRDQLATINLVPEDHILTYFNWRNGAGDSSATIGDLSLIPGFYPLSLEESVTNYRAFRDDPRWTVGWLPVLADGGGDFYIVDLTAAGRGEVRQFRVEEIESPVEYRTLAAMAATLAEALERGFIFVTDEGYLDTIYDHFDDLAARMNPGVQWWTEP